MKSLHFTVLPSHTAESARKLVEDLKSAVITVSVSTFSACQLAVLPGVVNVSSSPAHPSLLAAGNMTRLLC